MKSRNSLYLKRLLILFVLTQPFALFAKGIKQAAEPDFMDYILHNLILIVGFILAAVVYLVLFRFLFTLMGVQKRRILQSQGIEIPKQPEKVPLWDRIYAWATKMVPVAQEADVMLDHNYDGIKELDNSLPPWWVAMFYITTIAGVAYFSYYHYFDYGLSSSETYALEMKYANEAKERFLEKQANLVNESNVTALEDPVLLASGGLIYKNNCLACHGALGEGGVGPNLTDDYWLHGSGDIKSVFKTVKYGVPLKGMIAWKTQMNAASMHQVASYILTLKGTNPPNGKEPQGQLVKQEGQVEKQALE